MKQKNKNNLRDWMIAIKLPRERIVSFPNILNLFVYENKWNAFEIAVANINAVFPKIE